MVKRREGKPGTKAPTEYDIAPACFSGSNPDLTTNGPVAQPEEATDSKPVQCRFESDQGYLLKTTVGGAL